MASARQKLNKTIEQAEKKGYKVKQVGSKVLIDYAGMNHYAAKSMGFKGCKPKEILIHKGLTAKTKDETLRHELCEIDKMKKGDSYWQAHKHAMKKVG